MEKVVSLKNKIFSISDLVKEINFTYQNLRIDKEVEYDRNRKCINIYDGGVKSYYAISFRNTGEIINISPKIESYLFKWLYSYWVVDYRFRF